MRLTHQAKVTRMRCAVIQKLKAFNLYILIYPAREQKVSFLIKKSIQIFLFPADNNPQKSLAGIAIVMNIYSVLLSVYPRATSRIIIREKPTAKKRVPMLECSPADISGMSSSTTT